MVGPGDLVKLIMDVGKGYPSLEMVPAVYRHVGETIRLVDAYKSKVDIFLFAGPIPFEIASNHGYDIPMVYIPYTGTALYRVLFQLMKDAGLQDFYQRLRLSVDMLSESEVQEQMAELDIDLQELFVKEYQVGQSLEEICDFHHDLWVKRRIDTIVTCVTSVYESLRARGVPCYRIIPTRSAIHDSLHMVQLEGKNLKMRGTQLVISIISVGGLSDSSSFEGALQRREQEIQKILLGLGEKNRNLIYRSDSNEIMFVTTRGVIEELTNKFTEFPLLDEIQGSLQLPVNQGIGIGYTAGEAEFKAREALVKAESAGDGQCYAVLQNGTVLGPLGKQVQLNYSIRSDDPERLKLAKAAGVSVGTINRLFSLNERLDRSTVTAGELANWFDIKLRSARRILSKLEEKRLAVVVGEEQPVNKGRPRRLYTLNLR